MKSVLLVLALGACSSTQPGQFPTGIGGPIAGAGGTGGGGGGGTLVDAKPGIDAAPTGFADATVLDGPIVHGHVVGRLCAVHDLRTLTPCVPLTGTALHVQVTPGGGDSLVAPDGSYDVPSTTGGAPVIVSTSTTDPTYFGSAMLVTLDAGGNGDLDLPVMTRDDETMLAATNALTLAAGTGILVVHVVTSTGAAASGATLSTQGAISARYDAGDPFLFTPTPPTGQAGTALYFGLIDTQDYTVTSVGGTTQSFEAVVVADTLSFTTATLKPQ